MLFYTNRKNFYFYACLKAFPLYSNNTTVTIIMPITTLSRATHYTNQPSVFITELFTTMTSQHTYIQSYSNAQKRQFVKIQTTAAEKGTVISKTPLFVHRPDIS